MCACAAHPRSGLAPMMPTRIFSAAPLFARSHLSVQELARSSTIPKNLSEQHSISQATPKTEGVGRMSDLASIVPVATVLRPRVALAGAEEATHTGVAEPELG